MLRPSPNHGTLRLPNDDDVFDCLYTCACLRQCVRAYVCACVFVLLALFTQLLAGWEIHVMESLEIEGSEDNERQYTHLNIHGEYWGCRCSKFTQFEIKKVKKMSWSAEKIEIMYNPTGRVKLSKMREMCCQENMQQ